ncbi:hypothetical protein RvY_15152 [Ramazzottius varieornatus]|uniref:G-protein coupled receptors family 1 profile domain-containing protein n=1 Tax=Ramazzottius varieornatus TaxID=947166 RepID=A0A1D1W0V3_RAMVA|nr:hypothetical protein RvY_15152 [Ramazzottius varieornatus]
MSRGVAFGGLSGPKLKDWEILVDDCSRTKSHNHSHHHTDGTTGTLVEFFPVVAIPLLICLSTVGNGLNIIVLFRYCRSGAKRVFLLALAVSDTVVM